MNEQSREIIKSLAEMAWADGEVSPEEQALLMKVLIEAGVDPDDMDDFQDLLGPASEHGASEVSSLENVIADEDSRLNVMRALLIMSFMDGILSFAEFSHIEKVSKQLHISDEQMETLRAEALEAAQTLRTENPA